MDHSPTTGQSVGSRIQAVDQFELLIADVESFLDDWLQRLDQLQAVSATPDAHLRKRIHDFELDKSQWEAKRKREEEAARKAGFAAPAIYSFNPDDYPGYTHQNTTNEQSAADGQTAFATFVFFRMSGRTG